MAMLTREEVWRLGLEARDRLGVSWAQVGEAIGRSPVYAALLVYGYGQANAEEADGLMRVLALPKESRAALMKAPHRAPALVSGFSPARRLQPARWFPATPVEDCSCIIS